ncbi:MAG: TRAP transporter large permease [Rhizobiaceae bacterium]
MEVGLIILLVFVVLLVLLAIEVPVAFCLAASGTFGLMLLRGQNVAGATLASVPYQAAASFTMTVVPMFILMGMLAMHANIAEDLFRITNRIFRRVTGGVAVATVITCAGFSAVCGSSVATAATVGRLTIAEMEKYGFSSGFAAAVVASAGTLGVLIPPSIALVLFGIITNESIGKLLIAGIIPGILSAVIMGVGILVFARMGVGFDRKATAASSTPVVQAGGYGGVMRLAVLFAIVIGGIYSGLITATEAAAIGALAALVMLLMRILSERMSLWPTLFGALRESASVTSMVFAIIVGSSIFSYFIVSAGVPTAFSNWVLGFELPPLLLVLLLLLSLIPLGMFLDGVSILLITVPLFYPVVVGELGYDGLWYAILTVKMIELGLITPPVGVNAFIVSSMVRDRGGLEMVFRNIWAFIILDLIIFAVLFAFPGIVSWLPGQVR